MKFSFPWFGLDPRRPSATPARVAYSDSCKLIDNGLKLSARAIPMFWIRLRCFCGNWTNSALNASLRLYWSNSAQLTQPFRLLISSSATWVALGSGTDRQAWEPGQPEQVYCQRAGSAGEHTQ